MKNKIDSNDYTKCLFSNERVAHKQSIIKSAKHKVFSVSTKKKMLDPLDDKRYICNNKINTLAWGHYELQNIQKTDKT